MAAPAKTADPTEMSVLIHKRSKTRANLVVVITDEAYILDLCDDVLGKKSSRQHQVGDGGPPILVAAFFADFKLAIDFVKVRMRADDERAESLAEDGVSLLLFDKRVFALNDAGRLARDPVEDKEIVRGCLSEFLKRQTI